MKHKNPILTPDNLDHFIIALGSDDINLNEAKAFFNAHGITINAGTKTRFIKELTKLVNK